MKHACSVLAKCEYDPEEKAVDETVNLVSEHYNRRLDDKAKYHKKSVEEAQLKALLAE